MPYGEPAKFLCGCVEETGAQTATAFGKDATAPEDWSAIAATRSLARRAATLRLSSDFAARHAAKPKRSPS